MQTSALQHLPITMVEIEWLLARKDPHNPRSISDGALQRLVGVIGKHGFVEPCVYNEQLDLLVGGHQRLEAALAVGYTHVPCVTGRWNDLDHRALRDSLNAEYGIWERAMLKEEILYLQEQHYDLDYTGLPPWQIEDLLSDDGALGSAAMDTSDDPDGQALSTTHTCPQCGHTFAETA